MNENYVHVNSYVKHDGTEVKEHIRRKPDCDGINGCYPKPQSPMNVLQGGVEINDYIDNYPVNEKKGSGDNSGNILGAILSTAGFALNVGAEALNIVSKLQSPKQYYNSNEIRDLKTNLHTKISRLKETQKVSEKENEKRLERLINTTNQKDYANLYNTFVQQRELNKRNNDVLKRIEYASKNEDYKTLNSELLNFQSNYQDVVNKIHKEKPLEIEKNFHKKFLNIVSPYSQTPLMNSTMQNVPLFQKYGIDMGMFWFNFGNSINDAKELWKAASHDFIQSKDYIQKNGSLIYSISELPSSELRNTVRDKLLEQLGIDDTIGIIFNSDSSLSQAISNSREIKEHFKKFVQELLMGKVIKQASTYFGSNQNLSKALGHADILYTYINEDGNLFMIVLDTYDFNQGDSDWKVQQARSVQEAGYLRNYYILSVVIIAKNIWQKWMI